MAKGLAKKPKKRTRLMKLQHRSGLLMSFGTRLRTLRESKGFSPSQFCSRSGVDAGNLAKYESGIREPGLILMAIFAKTLGVELKELVALPLDFELEK